MTWISPNLICCFWCRFGMFHDIIVPLEVSEAHFVFHASFELVSFLQTFIKLHFVVLNISLIKARWTRIFQKSLLLFSFCFIFFVIACMNICCCMISCMLRLKVANETHCLRNFPSDVRNTWLFPFFAWFEQFLSELYGHIFSVLWVFSSQMFHKLVVMVFELWVFVHSR